MKPGFKGKTDAYRKQILSLRRHLHRFPELSGEEHDTSETVQEKLDEHGIPFTTGYAKTGVLGVVGGGRPGIIWPNVRARPAHSHRPPEAPACPNPSSSPSGPRCRSRSA